MIIILKIILDQRKKSHTWSLLNFGYNSTYQADGAFEITQ
uniref:Uncharacterized protein n=1 Tax=Anguilla anguilla TaxID=7936 RepID=A0A0E9R1U2_ANGAN